MTAHDKEYVGRRKLGWAIVEVTTTFLQLLFLSWLAFSLLGIMTALTARADSTFVPIEKPKPTICQRVCPVCGGCVPMFSCYDRDTKLPRVSIYDSISFYCTGKTVGGTLPSFKMSAGDYYSCDSIVWGRWKRICRVDTVDGDKWLDSVSAHTGIRPDINVSPFLDTIYTGDPRCNNSLNPIGDKQKK